MEEYIQSQFWCCFKNNNRSLFDRTLWIKGAVEFKHKDVHNLVTEDVTIYYKDNVRQLRGFNGNQKPLEDQTLSHLCSQNLYFYIQEYYQIKGKMEILTKELLYVIKNDNYPFFKKYFKKIIKNHCIINSYEYLISSLGQELYNSLNEKELKFYNEWKNHGQIDVSEIYLESFTYIASKYSILDDLDHFKMYVHVNEILNLLNNKITIETLLKRIEKRKNGFVLLNLHDKKYTNKVVVHTDAVNIIKNHLEKLENSSLQFYNENHEIKGKSTFPSSMVISGPCVVLKNNFEEASDFFNKIVVCPVTTAADVCKYLDAKALVVDHGGILSHAAIFSREFGKPCLMGCDVATKVFQTGDILEIDFKKEVVYKK